MNRHEQFNPLFMRQLKSFIIYSSKDKFYREELESHLQPIIDLGYIKLWSDKQILPGEEWDAAIKKNLNNADLILMLISIDFYNSSYIQNEEFKIAIQRLNQGKSIVVPIIIRPCLWKIMPVIKDIQVLPVGGKAIGDEDHWKMRDKAWENVAEGVLSLIEKWFQDKPLNKEEVKESEELIVNNNNRKSNAKEEEEEKQPVSIEVVQRLLAEGKTEEALKALHEIAENTEYERDLIMLSHFYYDLNKKRLTGILSYEESAREYNRIVAGLLDIAGNFKKSTQR